MYNLHPLHNPPDRPPAKDLYSRLLFTVIIPVLVFMTLCPGITPFISPAAAGTKNVLEKRYNLAKIYYQNLSTHKSLGKSRARWESNIGNFRKIYLAAPKEELGMRSLFMMGRLHYEMYRRFYQASDLEDAIAYYDDVALLFPEASLADDALYILGMLYLHDKKNRQRASDTFFQITCQYAGGDMAKSAAEQLAELSSSQPPPAADTHPGKLASVLPVKHWSTDDYTRIVVQVSAPVNYSKQLLEKQGDRPRRLVLDFAKSQVPPKACAPIPIQDGLLKRVRIGQFTRDTVRVVLDIESISSYKIFTLQDPFRTVVDVKGWEQEKKIVAKSTVPAAPLKKKIAIPQQAPAVDGVAPTLAQQLGLGIKKIVIDPGHGGRDPGAIAPNGLKEKDVVLAVSLKLADILRKKFAYDVVLTRTRDTFLPLEERTAIANTHKGDLFISVHVNSAPTPRLLGVETYVLNLTNDKEAMQLAALENATSTSKMSDLQNILADLLANNKLDESTKLADHVQSNIASGLQIKDLGVKQAPFYVLIGARMPAILCEITFLSNPDEARRLTRDSYLSSIAGYMSTGVESYIRNAHLALVFSPQLSSK
jgi:N-acetylmuramoyl-L-alanine amidase